MSCNNTVLEQVVWIVINCPDGAEDSLTLNSFIFLSYFPLISQAAAVIYSLPFVSLTWLAVRQPASTPLLAISMFTPNCPDARTYAHHRGVFQAAKWGYGLIFLDVQSVFLTNSQISARDECQQGCAGWDKLRQVTTGGRREECRGKLQEFYAFLSTYCVKIKHISAIKLRIGLSVTCTFFVRTYMRLS